MSHETEDKIVSKTKEITDSLLKVFDDKDLKAGDLVIILASANHMILDTVEREIWPKDYAVNPFEAFISQILNMRLHEKISGGK